MTVFIAQKLITKLFKTNVRTINEHLQNLFKSNKLDENSAIKKFQTTAFDRKNCNTQFYNFNSINSIGYRGNPTLASQLKQWVTNMLRNYEIKGWVLDKERFKGIMEPY